MRRLWVLVVLLASMGCSVQEKPTLLVFTAPWCKFCKFDEPRVDRLRSTYNVIKIDYDTDPATVKYYNVSALPTYILIRGDQVIARSNQLRDIENAQH